MAISGNTEVTEKIIHAFNQLDIKYALLNHAPVYTSEEAAKIRDTSAAIGAKALVWFADGMPILTVIPGNKKLDTKKFKEVFSIKDLRFATSEEVEELTSLEIGAIPPTGKILSLPAYYDKSFLDMDDVAFNAGSHTVSIKMKAQDLIKSEEPLLEDIAK